MPQAPSCIIDFLVVSLHFAHTRPVLLFLTMQIVFYLVETVSVITEAVISLNSPNG